MFRRALPNDTPPLTLQQLKEILDNNTKVVIIRFTASWCGPCQRILPYFNSMADIIKENGGTVLTIDIDQCIEIYTYYKSKKMINGVPTIMAFYAGNTSMYPDNVVIGADLQQLEFFFRKVFSMK
jgi:thiol-disulfide isomerase/thioredoxin